jgi:hypothetical protein
MAAYLRLAVATVLLAVATASAKASDPKPHHFRLFRVQASQLDWFASDRAEVARDTFWLAFEYTYHPLADGDRFLNVVARAPGGNEAWVIENLPIFEDVSGEHKPVRETAYVNLAQLGLQPGADLTSICYTATLTLDMLETQPTGELRCIDVSALEYVAGDDESFALAGPFDPGAPEPISFQEKPTKLGTNKKQTFNSVQEDDKQCMAGALARSLDWLNREYTLGSKKKAQKIYADLVKAGTTQLGGPGDSAAATEGKRLAAKQTYVNQEFGGKVVTKTWDPGANVDTPTGMTESGGDFAAWLKAEWETEDVELAFRSAGFAHIVTLTEVAENADGSFKVKYRDDGQQRDDNGGDNGPKNGKIFKSGGTWYFGNTNLPLLFAISESPVTPTPSPTPTRTPTPSPTPPPSPTSTPTAPTTATPSPSGTPN